MRIKKIINPLLLISIICCTYSFKSNAESISLNSNIYSPKEIVIKNQDFKYKDITSYISEYIMDRFYAFGNNTVILCSEQNSQTFKISIFNNKTFEKQSEITLDGLFMYAEGVDGGYLIITLEDNALFVYKISEDGTNIFFKKKVKDISDTYSGDIYDLKVFDNRIVFVTDNEIVILSLQGDYISSINIEDLTGINNLKPMLIFDTGTNYTILCGLESNSSPETYLINISYDGLYQNKINFPTGLVPVIAKMLNSNEYIGVGVNYNTYKYVLVKFKADGTILSKIECPNDIMYSNITVFNNKIYALGIKRNAENNTMSAIISEFDESLNKVNDYIINSESITNTIKDGFCPMLYTIEFTEDRIFNGYLASLDQATGGLSGYLLSVDLNEIDAIDAVDIATLNPTQENMEFARKLVNNLKESDKKEELQNQLNQINISMDLEKKNSSVNLDVYIKSENMLLMNLSTNSITFNDYSGLDEIEQQNVVEISINSSLPYQLNAYLLEEMYNNDKTKKIDMDRLQIKDNTDDEYKEFTAINEKLVLKDNCDAGNDKIHNIDLKLKGGNAYESDIYKTVIKFEAEQK